jgi:hypothetical protein
MRRLSRPCPSCAQRAPSSRGRSSLTSRCRQLLCCGAPISTGSCQRSCHAPAALSDTWVRDGKRLWMSPRMLPRLTRRRFLQTGRESAGRCGLAVTARRCLCTSLSNAPSRCRCDTASDGRPDPLDPWPGRHGRPRPRQNHRCGSGAGGCPRSGRAQDEGTSRVSWSRSARGSVRSLPPMRESRGVQDQTLRRVLCSEPRGEGVVVGGAAITGLDVELLDGCNGHAHSLPRSMAPAAMPMPGLLAGCARA